MNERPEDLDPASEAIMWEQGYGSWLELIFDPDDPYGVDRLEDLEV